MGLLLPPPTFQPIIFWFKSPSFFSPGSAQALKRLLTTRFAKKILNPPSALKVHGPYISHKIADSHFIRGSFVTEALVSQNGLSLPKLGKQNTSACSTLFLLLFLLPSWLLCLLCFLVLFVWVTNSCKMLSVITKSLIMGFILREIVKRFC